MPPQPMLTLTLPGSLHYKKLILVDLEEPSTWLLVETSGREVSLASGSDRAQFFQDISSSYKVPLELIYVSVAQDAAGRHFFLCLDHVSRVLQWPDERDIFKFVGEFTVKSRRETEGAVMLYARPEPPTATQRDDADLGAAPQLADDATGRQQLDPSLDEKILCPKACVWGQNYDVIPELSIGQTQKLILCDEATLTRKLPTERIFEYLSLIVNCHENKARIKPGFYQVGACSTNKKIDVIAREVHRWHSLTDGDMNRYNDEIQERIWEGLQTGTVAVHCLAGIHRAACIVACHFLWRHYVLGDHSIPSDQDKIYSILKAHRPAVSPAYTSVLASYKKHLMTRALQA